MGGCGPWLMVVALIALSCGPSPDTVRQTPPPVERGKEELQRDGHTLALRHEWDSASVLLEQSLALDPLYAPALQDLAELNYSRAAEANRGEVPGRDGDYYRSEALRSYMRLEAAGSRDAEVYERLCELSVAQGDSQSFARYAVRYAERYPYDRQYYNLGLAYFGVGEYQNVIRSQKEAITRFPESEFLGSFYRQLGRAYMKVDRDQTAERTLAAGVRAVEERLASLPRPPGTEGRDGSGERRLSEDRIAMLLLLRTLHQRYRATDKLEQVERQLNAAGYTH